MSVNWGNYSPFQTELIGQLRDLPRKEARSEHDRLMKAKADRVAQLQNLLAINGVQLTDSDASIQDLNDWFREELEPNPTQEPYPLVSDWYPVILDIGLFLGEVMNKRCPHLRWEFFTAGKKNVAYQSPVIMGFTRAENHAYNIDPTRLVATYAHRIAAGQQVEEDAFWRWLKSAELSCYAVM